uniref:Smr domain-containing protein n=1 Tax=Caenorhabditis tropicalis TaxID=1561998 RepID=A0A1I7UWT0_9PELO
MCRKHSSEFDLTNIARLKKEIKINTSIIKTVYFECGKNVEQAKEELLKKSSAINIKKNKDEAILRKLRDEFGVTNYCEPAYEISCFWLSYWFEINGKNEEMTRRVLVEDEARRREIKDLYASRQNYANNGDQKLEKQCSAKINAIVRRRNLALDKIDSVKSQLKFDLHWFTLEGAMKFVEDICDAMLASKTRLKYSDEEVALITGHGRHSASSESVIQKKIIEEYKEFVRKDENNAGIVYLFFEKK